MKEVGHGSLLRSLVESFKKGEALSGEAVFLQAAVGFFGDGVLDQARRKCWDNIGFPESSSAFQSKRQADVFISQRLPLA